VSLADSLPAGVAEAGSLGVERTIGAVPDSLIGFAVRSRADLRALELDAVAARADAQLAARERVPGPALSLGFKNDRVPGADAHANGFVAGVSVPLPLWDRRSGAIAAADAESRRRLAEVDAFRRRVAREVAEAYDAYVALETQLATLTPQLGPETRSAMRAVQVAYAEGEVTLVEWLDAVRAYQEAETILASLRADAVIRRAALERALGAPLPHINSSRSGADAPTQD
jgi:cobalt-zinc-cadmium efflux system outer membrane protein